MNEGLINAPGVELLSEKECMDKLIESSRGKELSIFVGDKVSKESVEYLIKSGAFISVRFSGLDASIHKNQRTLAPKRYSGPRDKWGNPK